MYWFRVTRRIRSRAGRITRATAGQIMQDGEGEPLHQFLYIWLGLSDEPAAHGSIYRVTIRERARLRRSRWVLQAGRLSCVSREHQRRTLGSFCLWMC